MRVVGVSRILNEADIVEPFIRHHATLLDLHIVLDNGSTDGTLDILQALHAEGIPLQVYQTVSPIFLETEYNTGLYRLALQEGADWVLFLDADELLVAPDPGRAAESLELTPSGIAALRLPVFRYARPPPDHNPFMRLRDRGATPEMHKIALSRLDPARVAVYAGNHFAFIDGREDLGLTQDRLWLAHVPDRSPLQLARKTILARLKSIASGQAAERHFTVHRLAEFAALQTDASAWLAAAAQPQRGIAHPTRYRGADLRYTAPLDDVARLLEVFAAEGERLARSHGGILDAKRLIKQNILDKGKAVRRLF